MNSRARWLMLAPAVLLAFGLGWMRFAAPPPGNMTGSSLGGAFALIDQDGQPVTDGDFKGRYRLMYFGYTFCPDVCPTDAQNIGAGLKLVEQEKPALGAKVTPVFVTVDPARDTPAVVRQFTAAFHPRMVGLTGSPQAIAAAEKAYAVFAQKGDPSPGGGYLMNHSRQAYLMDPAGKPVALIPADKGPRAVADEIERWAT